VSRLRRPAAELLSRTVGVAHDSTPAGRRYFKSNRSQYGLTNPRDGPRRLLVVDDPAFRNLLTNAIQHNDKDVPEVTVTATEREDRVIVRVADNGPGISDTQKGTVFGEGQKGLDSRGTGFGLHLVETPVEQYGGDVRIEDNESTGAIFVVDLPKAA
jgi:phosphoglycerate-specific signal transduction histidine kinase